MLRKLVMLACIISFCPAAAGAQDVALLLKSQPAQEQAAEVNKTLDLMPAEERAPLLLAAADLQGVQEAQEQRPRRTHSGLTFREFSEVHFGEGRWIYWAGAVAAIVLLHVAVAD